MNVVHNCHLYTNSIRVSFGEKHNPVTQGILAFKHYTIFILNTLYGIMGVKYN